jgi:hypothetical protein
VNPLGRDRDVLARIIASGIPDADRADPIAPADAWPGVFTDVREQRTTGFAMDAWERGGLVLTDDQHAELLAAHRDSMLWCVFVETKLLALAEAFEREGIAFAVLKGASLAHTIYPDPSLRSFGDIDLLVASRDYYTTCEVLARMGHERQRPEPRPGFEARFGKASVHVDPRDHVEVDLHRALVLGPIGQRVHGEDLLAHTSTFPLGGRELPRLDDTGQLISVAMHAALGFRPPRLVPLRDTVAAIGMSDVDLDLLRRWSDETSTTSMLAFAARTALQTFGQPANERLAEIATWPITRRGRSELDQYVSDRRAAGALPVGTLRSIHGLRDKVAYVRGLLMPQRAFLQAREGSDAGGTYIRRWKHAGKETAGRLRMKVGHERGDTT